ncbi:MAG: protein kinase [Deltaproteobacteria bacterium]|nr:protein kinase [Deltaproteobacteria bacterium]
MEPGELIADRFRVESTIGSGGMGTVLRAFDVASGERVAVKLLRQAMEKAELVRFEREAELLADLRHPAIVGYVAHGAMPSGEPFLVMQWLDGIDLAQRLRRDGVTADEALILARRVAEALGVAHALGVVHRDVKPANVLLVGNDVRRAALIDFGLARAAPDRTGITMLGSVLGTPEYMSPEQARGDSDVDARADVFALGCVLYEMLTGRSPFGASTPVACLARVLLEEPASIAELRNDLPEALCDLVTRMLSKDRVRRPAHGADVAARLVEIGTIEGARASRASLPTEALSNSEQRIHSVVMAVAPEPSELFEVAVELEGYGGQTQCLSDRSLIAVFAHQATPLEQAASAARAALAVGSLLPSAIVVLATGRGAQSHGHAVGDAIERAAALLGDEAGRASGRIAIDAVTAGCLESVFVIGREGGRFFLGAERTGGDAVRTVLGKPTPFVGREREMGLVEATLAEVDADSVARVVLVTGPPGAGKSRLRHEMIARARDRYPELEILVARGDALACDSPLGLLAQLVRAAAGIASGDAPSVAQAKLRARVTPALSPSRERETFPEPTTALGTGAARVVAFLGKMIGLPLPDDAGIGSARHDPSAMAEMLSSSWTTWLAAECRAHPMLLVLDDLQWGDRPSIELLDLSLFRLSDQPLGVVAFGRPDVRDQLRDSWRSRGLLEVSLTPLTRRASERLVKTVLGSALDESVVARIVERAEGNAFHLEELMLSARDGGDRIPETILGMVQSRLDVLEERQRRVLRAASVFGERFRRGGVVALLGGKRARATVDAALAALVEHEVLTAGGPRAVGDEREYAFAQSLLRDVAYEMLTDEDRKLAHRLAGDWLERAGEPNTVVKAVHFDRGGQPERALVWWARAAREALEANDLETAIERAERAVSAGASGEILGEARLVQAEALRWKGGAPELVSSRAIEAASLLPEGSAPWFHAMCEAVSVAHGIASGREERARSLAARTFAVDPSPDAVGACLMGLARAGWVASELGDADTVVRAMARAEEIAAAHPELDTRARAWLSMARASDAHDPGRFAAEEARTVELFEQSGDERNANIHRVNAAHALAQLGQLERAEPMLHASIAFARRHGIGRGEVFALQDLAYVLTRMGKHAAALEACDTALSRPAVASNQRMAGSLRSYRAALLLAMGDAPGAEQQARAAIALLFELAPLLAHAHATLSRALLAQGRAQEALAAADDAMAVVAQRSSDDNEALARLARIEALDALGRADDAHAALVEAHAALTQRASVIGDPTYREGFLRGVAEHARTMDLAAARGIAT